MQSIDKLMDFELCDEAIYLAGLNELNDPNGGRCLVRFSENISDIKSFFSKVWKMNIQIFRNVELKLKNML